MKPSAKSYQEIPLQIVGSTKFGRYPKISVEETWNFIISDNWLVPSAGYKSIQTIDPNGQGRGIYASEKLDKLFVVINNDVYYFDSTLNRFKIGNINTFAGDVFIAENNAGQVAFSDLSKIYIYDNNTGLFTAASIDFVPGYITFQNGRFISPARTGNVDYLWRLSDLNNGVSWPTGTGFTGSLQTKPDRTVAAVRFPARGNLLLIFGETVAEQWIDNGNPLFPYQRSQSTNIDYGCINAATIGEMDNIVCWIGANEKSGPVIMYTNGGDPQHISTDGIDFKFSTLKNPSNSYGFMFKQDGHVIYVVTFPDDNLSYMYDFNTKAFFTLTDEHGNYFIAKRVVFFNNKYYFVSFRDGNLYEFGTQFTTYDYGTKVYEIPRVRIVPNIRLPDQSRFIAGYTGFTIEQGMVPFPDRNTSFALMTQDYNNITMQNLINLGGGFNYRDGVPRVDLSLSKDGGVSYGSIVSRELNSLGVRQNRLMWWRLGQANDLVLQFRFVSFGRFVATNGVTGIHM